MGRPRIEFDKEQFETMCKLQCTQKEILAVLNINYDTLRQRLHDYYGDTFRNLYARFSEHGIVALRRQLFKRAIEDKRDQVLIHALDRYIGPIQRDVNVTHKLQQPAIIEKLDGGEIILGSTEIKEITDADKSEGDR